MSYEVKTPALARVIEAAFDAVDGIKDGTLEKGEAMALSSQLSRVNTAVATDVKARLAAPKIAAYEAKNIEGSVSGRTSRALT